MLRKSFDALLSCYFKQPQKAIKNLDHLEQDVMGKIDALRLDDEPTLWVGLQFQAASVVIALFVGVSSSVMNVDNKAIQIEEFSPNSPHLSLNLDRYL